MTVAFDTLKAATRLQDEAGFEEKQARTLVAVLAEGMVENLVTKDDIEKVETSLRSDIEKVETSLRSDIEKVETSLRSEMRELEQRMVIKLGGMIAAAAGFLVVIDKLL